MPLKQPVSLKHAHTYQAGWQTVLVPEPPTHTGVVAAITLSPLSLSPLWRLIRLLGRLTNRSIVCDRSIVCVALHHIDIAFALHSTLQSHCVCIGLARWAHRLLHVCIVHWHWQCSWQCFSICFLFVCGHCGHSASQLHLCRCITKSIAAAVGCAANSTRAVENLLAAAWRLPISPSLPSGAASMLVSQCQTISFFTPFTHGPSEGW